MDWIQLVVLAIVQGVTEFLPISSSAHLILPAQLGGWPDQGLAFDVAVHLGTLGAVLAYFRADLGAFAGGAWRLAMERRIDPHAELLLKVGVATLPVIICGFLMKSWVETDLRSIPVIAGATIIFAALLWYADRQHGARDTVNWRDSIVIGLMQTLALVPGTSRSGITLTAALLLGLSRTAGARFSFLLSIPTILGAAILMTAELVERGGPVDWSGLAAAALLSAGAAYGCIRTFIALIERTGMTPYVVYRFCLGAVLLLVWYRLTN